MLAPLYQMDYHFMVLKTPKFDFLCPMSKWAGAISTLIPWLCISAQSCSWLQLYVDYCLDDDAIFPVVSGEIIYWKIRFPGNIKSYPTLPGTKFTVSSLLIKKQKYSSIFWPRNWMKYFQLRQEEYLVMTNPGLLISWNRWTDRRKEFTKRRENQ